MLNRTHNRGHRPEILFLTNHPVEDPSCRFRIFQFLPYFEQAGFRCHVCSFTDTQLYYAIRRSGHYLQKFTGAFSRTLRRISDLRSVAEYDIVMIHREVFPFLTPLFENLVTSRHTRVVFGFDDSIHIGHADTSNLPHPFLYRFKYGRGIETVLRNCALITPGNRTLAEYARQFNRNVVIVPTVIDVEAYAFREREPDGQIVIGWFGSRSTSPYLSIVEPALRRLAAIHGSTIGFCFYGDAQYQSDLPNSRVVPFSVESELAELGKLHIGLMPLPDDAWTRGKCSLKALQYMARGVPVVASPVGMAADVVQHGVNGFCARNAEEWFHYLQILLTGRALREEFAKQGRKTVEQSYSLQTWGPRLANMFSELLARPVIPTTEVSAA